MKGGLPRRPTRNCGFCHEELPPEAGFSAMHLPPQDLIVILANNPWWHPETGICAECASRFAEARQEAASRYPAWDGGACPILPTPVRLGARADLTGRGVTIAFLDSGFYAHPDLVAGDDRILRYVDITNPHARRGDLATPDESSWHGMMTSVVACGNGRLSHGLYRGLASEARLVLVKVGTARRIVHDNIRRGLDWVIRHRRRYNIRVVNVSCGGDYEASYLVDALSHAADRATREGILVVCAAGNLGHRPRHPILPPASSPSVLTVGGLDDQNRLARTERETRTPAGPRRDALSTSGYQMYHSSYGPTVDGLQKPEVIAPGIWIAAPILPGTPTAAQADLLAKLAAAPDESLKPLIAANPRVDLALDEALGLEEPLIRQLVSARLRDANVISGAYKHVDGTSFAAPIVSSLAAQMLEANPRLTPQELKLLLMRTACRLPDVPVDRQGWGVVDARRATEEAERWIESEDSAGEAAQGRAASS